MLRDTIGSHKSGGFDLVGTDAEVAPLTLDKVMSYDEMAVSALIAISGPTIFINNGNRFSVSSHCYFVFGLCASLHLVILLTALFRCSCP